jgi:hypothetical protein
MAFEIGLKAWRRHAKKTLAFDPREARPSSALLFRQMILSEWLPSLCSNKRVIAPADAGPESRRSGDRLCHYRFTVEANHF